MGEGKTYFAPSAKSDSATFLVLEKGYSGDAYTDFDAKYVKRCFHAKNLYPVEMRVSGHINADS